MDSHELVSSLFISKNTPLRVVSKAKSRFTMYELVFIGQGLSLLAFHLCDLVVTLEDLWCPLSDLWVTLKVSPEITIFN